MGKHITFALTLLLAAGGAVASPDGETQRESQAPEAEAAQAQSAETGARIDVRPCEATHRRLAARLRSETRTPGGPPAAVGKRPPAEEAKLLREALERDPATVACLLELMARQPGRRPSN